MKKLILLGSVSKTLLYPVFLAVTLIIYNIINKSLNENIGGQKIYLLIGFLSQTLGTMAIRLIPIIFKYESDNIKTHKKDCFYLSIIAIILFTVIFSLKFIDIGINFNIVNVLCLNEILDIIILLALTKFFLKYNYYIHNIISLILFCIFGIIIDLILGYYKNLKLVDSIYYLEGIMRCVLACYVKYMMDTKYYKYWNILFVIGIIFFILSSIIFIFYSIFNSNDLLEIEFKFFIMTFFLNLILAGFLQFLLLIMMVYVLTPNHSVIASEILYLVIYKMVVKIIIFFSF